MTRETAENKAWIASIPQAVRTVNISVVIALISLVISMFTLFWNVRPARIEPLMSAVFASREGGIHVSIPLSIANSGARATAVLAAKLIESAGGQQTIWNADFTADPNRAIPAMTGAVSPNNSALWVPFSVAGNSEVEKVFIFRPLAEGPRQLIGSGRTVSYRVVLLLSDMTSVENSAAVTWPAMTDGVMKQKRGGVASMGAEIDRWISQASP